MKLKELNVEFHNRFNNVDELEIVLCSKCKKLIYFCLNLLKFKGFPASLRMDIWTQGRIFVTQFSLNFFSSLLGMINKVFLMKFLSKLNRDFFLKKQKHHFRFQFY